MTNGRVNPQFTLEDQGITGLGTVYYNLLEPTLIEQALARKEGTHNYRQWWHHAGPGFRGQPHG